MERTSTTLEEISNLNSLAAFNRWCNIRVEKVDPGYVEISIDWKEDLGQYSGFLHAGIVATLIDTACGFAAASMAGTGLLASHFSVNCLRPAVGEKFVAKARVVKPGKSQYFTACELFSVNKGDTRLVATGETLLSVVQAPGP